jgi:3',5'-cyclic AMP phosphodiesterase CpdA
MGRVNGGFTHKVIWISDLHQTVSGEVEGVASAARLDQLIAQINTYHADAACCVASGDLCDTGSAEEYQALNQRLAGLKLRFLPMIGNHDNPANFGQAFALPGQVQPGYAQFRYDLAGDVTLLCLDTYLAGSDAGAMDKARLDWLADQLRQTAERRVLVFTHHPPGPLGLGPLDAMPLLDHQPLIDLLRAAPQVEYLLCGHVHRPVSGVIGGVPFATLRALAHQTKAPTTTWGWDDFVAKEERPQYAVILIAADRIVIQFIDIEDPA